jgi:hypothetical protein
VIRVLALWALLLLSTCSRLAYADQQADPRPISWKDCTAGGISTTPFTIGPTQNLRGFFVQNPSTATESLFFDTAKTATTTGSPELIAAASVTWGPGTIFAGAMSVTAATGGHAFKCQYGS